MMIDQSSGELEESSQTDEKAESLNHAHVPWSYSV